MKKIMIALGIAFALFICGVFAYINKPVDPVELNAQGYRMAYQEVEKSLGNPTDYGIGPCVTRDGIVYKYSIRDLEADKIIGYVQVYEMA